MDLVRCPLCASNLIYPIDLAGGGYRTVVSRRCPECEHRDKVMTTHVAARAWFDRNTQIGLSLGALCEAIADGIPMCLEDFELSRSAAPDPGDEPER
jgi:hypothetical protein